MTPDLRLAADLCVHAYAPGSSPPAGAEHLHSTELLGRIQFSAYRSTGTPRGCPAPAADTLIIAYAGSNEPHDWLRHTMARRWRVPGHMLPPEEAPGPAACHRGWQADADSCLPTLVMLLHAHAAGIRRVILTGHSYGGPLAICSALSLLDRLRTDRIDLALITFGSPAPGNAAYAEIVNRHIPRHIRAANPLDIVTTLPAGRYAHPGHHLPIPAGWPAHSIHRYRDYIHAQPMDLSPGIHPV